MAVNPNACRINVLLMTKTAIVTGGTKGIGKAVCLRLLNEGWVVIATYASDAKTAGSLTDDFTQQFPNRFFVVQADCSQPESVEAIQMFIQSHSFQLDAIVFNAGLTDRSDFGTISLENWRRVFAANVEFPVFFLQALNDRINPHAGIVFTGSLMGIQPHAMSLAYGVSKASVHALVKNLVKFYADRYIRVNAVAPGFVDTDWQINKPSAIRQCISEKIALGRFCSPEELADVYLLLINNTYLNGEVVVCDGSYSYK